MNRIRLATVVVSLCALTACDGDKTAGPAGRGRPDFAPAVTTPTTQAQRGSFGIALDAGPSWSTCGAGSLFCTFDGIGLTGDAMAALEDPAGPSGRDPPIVFNASSAASAGDVVSLQGEFGATPRVYLDGSPGTALEIVNRVGTGWLAVRMPAHSRGKLSIRIASRSGVSAVVMLNVARPFHLDATQLVPGGAFRVFGRALRTPDGVPSVSINGQAATVDLSRSDAYMLSVTAPAFLAADAAATVLVDNGNGSGPMRLDRTIEVVASETGDPFGLGVGWAAGFAAVAGRTIDAASDPRLASPVRCDGLGDDSGAIRAAIDLAASLNGAVVRLPAGRCRLARGIELKSRVVVLGAGKALTELVYESDYAVYGVGVDLAGIGNLTLTNAGSVNEGPLLKDSRRIFMKNLRIQLKRSRQMYLTGNRHFAVVGCDFIQTASISDQGPYTFDYSSGLFFEGNTTRWVGGAPTFGHVHDSYLHANRFTRDARAQNDGGVVHSLTIDFAYRVAVAGNTLDVANGPIRNKQRNDGEAILTEGGGAARTENLGTVASATALTLSDPTNVFQMDPFGTGSLPENYGVAVVGGRGAGQTRNVVGGSGTTLTVDRAWDVVPDATSRYATFVWGLEKSSIRNNVLTHNPRGIWLYQTAIRDVDVVGNRISEGGGIFIRAYQNLSLKGFTPIYNLVIAGNTIRNTSREWMSYINAIFVNTDARPFGIAMLGIEMRSNALTANRPNVTTSLEDYASTEGYLNLMRVEEHGGYETSPMPRVLGTIMTDNLCRFCNVAIRIGTAAGGTTILGSRFVGTPKGMTDTTTTSSAERSTDTVMR